MTREQLRQRVERLLQDSENKRWTDVEINGYLDDAQLEFCRIAKIPKTSYSQNLVDTGTRQTDGSLSVSSKTVTITVGSSHSLVVDDSVLVSGSTNSTRNGGHIVASIPSNTSFTYILGSAETGSESSITIQETGPVFSKPSTILEMTSVTIDGRELAVYTEHELNGAANRYIGANRYLNTSLGPTPAPFFNLDSYYSTTKWRDVEGRIEAGIYNERSASTFRVFPLPSKDEHVYVDKDAVSKVSQTMIIQGVQNPDAMSADSSIPVIPVTYHESLVYGAVERAYLKESQLRNVDKSALYRAKFMEMVGEAHRNESMNSGTVGFGRNQLSHRVLR